MKCRASAWASGEHTKISIAPMATRSYSGGRDITIKLTDWRELDRRVVFWAAVGTIDGHSHKSAGCIYAWVCRCGFEKDEEEGKCAGDPPLASGS